MIHNKIDFSYRVNDFYFDFSSNVWRVFVFHILHLPACSYMFGLVLVDGCFVFCLAKLVLPMFELTTARIRNLRRNSNFYLKHHQAQFMKQLKDIIDVHNNALE